MPQGRTFPRFEPYAAPVNGPVDSVYTTEVSFRARARRADFDEKGRSS